uniref:Uncharacterized protein n=1 Tax=Aegilops tauschii TaxID=37682 RepID=N1R4L2_AEGTA
MADGSAAPEHTGFFLVTVNNQCWTVQDVRDGRVLLARDPDPQEEDEQPPVFTDLVVCDPLHRRFIVLPPVPRDLAASVDDPADPVFCGCFCEPSLIPPSEEEAAAALEETAFRVIWFAHSNIKVYTLVFSSSTRQWRAAASQGLTDLLTGEGELTMITPQHPLFRGHYYACGCVYWKWMTNERWKKLLVLDTRRMEFSIADLPLEAWNMADIAIVEAGEDKLGLFGLRDEFADVLCYIVGRKQGENLSHWQTEKTISLDYSYQHCIGATTGRSSPFTKLLDHNIYLQGLVFIVKAFGNKFKYRSSLPLGEAIEKGPDTLREANSPRLGSILWPRVTNRMPMLETIPWSHSQINIHVTKLREIVIATPWISRRRWPQLAYKMWESAVLHLVLLVILPFMFTWLN